MHHGFTRGASSAGPCTSRCASGAVADRSIGIVDSQSHVALTHRRSAGKTGFGLLLVAAGQAARGHAVGVFAAAARGELGDGFELAPDLLALGVGNRGGRAQPFDEHVGGCVEHSRAQLHALRGVVVHPVRADARAHLRGLAGLHGEGRAGGGVDEACGVDELGAQLVRAGEHAGCRPGGGEARLGRSCRRRRRLLRPVGVEGAPPLMLQERTRCAIASQTTTSKAINIPADINGRLVGSNIGISETALPYPNEIILRDSQSPE